MIEINMLDVRKKWWEGDLENFIRATTSSHYKLSHYSRETETWLRENNIKCTSDGIIADSVITLKFEDNTDALAFKLKFGI